MPRAAGLVPFLEQRVDERGDGAALREYDQQPEEKQQNDNRCQPELLANPKKSPYLAELRHKRRLSL